MLLHLCMQDSIKTHDCIIKEIPFIILWLRFEQENAFMAPVVTEVMMDGEFYPAEHYHQQYYAQHPNQPYCLAVAAPKVAKIREKYTERIKPQTRSMLAEPLTAPEM